LWPLAMSRRKGKTRTRWAFPVYAGQDSESSQWDAVFPLFYRGTKGSEVSTFVSPLYSGGRNREEETAWNLVQPLYYGSSSPEKSSTFVAPSFYRSTGKKGRSRTMLLPLFYRRDRGEKGSLLLSPFYSGGQNSEEETSWTLVPPLYYGSSSPEGSRTFISPSYYSSTEGKEEQSLLFPLFYRWTDGESSLFLTPPGGISRSSGEMTAYAFPLLSSYTETKSESDLWFLFPLTRARWSDALRESHVFPLYYWRRRDNLFLSLPFSYRNTGKEGFAMALGPVAGYDWGADTWCASFPLGLAGVAADSKEEEFEHWALPLWMYSGSDEGTFLNLGLPLFTYTSSPEQTNVHYLWPLGKVGSGKESSTNRLFPLWYYWNDAENGETIFNLAGPLFDYRASPEGTSIHYLWPLGKRTSNEKRSVNQFFPLWRHRYSAEKEETFLNLAMILLNYWSSPDETEFYTALPPAGGKWDEDGGQHGLWPLYFYGSGKESSQLHLGPFLPFGGPPGKQDVISLAGHTDREDGRSYWMVPFYDGTWSEYTYWRDNGQALKAQELVYRSWGFPLWFYESENFISESTRKTGPVKRYLPEEPPGNTTDFNLLLFLANYDSRTRERKSSDRRSSFNLLWRLYDYTREVTSKEDEPSAFDVYVRHRILWRVMHYERVNDYTTLDVFPGITWDSKPGEKETFSFLWRFLRYEWDDEKGTTFYFMFIPF
ncbi:MAG: hypothetical protein V5A84_04110, partial [Planctomycetota bacterium]